MKNLIGKKVMIDQFLTSDPFNKRGEVGTSRSYTMPAYAVAYIRLVLCNCCYG